MHASNGDNPVRGFADADVGTKQAPPEQKCNTFLMLAEHQSLCSLGNVSSLNASNSLARDVAAPNHVTWSHVPRPRKTRLLRLRTRADERIVPRPCRPSGEYGSANRIRPNPADRALTQKTPKANAGHIKGQRDSATMPASDSWGSTYRLKNTGMLKEWHMAVRRSSIKAARNKKRNLVRRLQIDSLERRDLLAVDFTLQILHASDMEAGLAAVDDAPQFAAIVDALEDTYPNSILLSSGDNYLSGPFFNASGDPSLEAVLGGGSSASIGRGDIEIMNRIGFDASVIGNHEFDLGPRELRICSSPRRMAWWSVSVRQRQCELLGRARLEFAP